MRTVILSCRLQTDYVLKLTLFLQLQKSLYHGHFRRSKSLVVDDLLKAFSKNRRESRKIKAQGAVQVIKEREHVRHQLFLSPKEGKTAIPISKWRDEWVTFKVTITWSFGWFSADTKATLITM